MRIELLLVWVACNVSLSEGLIVRAGAVQKNYSHSSNNDKEMASSLLFKHTLRRNSAVSAIRMSTSSSSTLSNDLTGKKKKKVAIIEVWQRHAYSHVHLLAKMMNWNY